VNRGSCQALGCHAEYDNWRGRSVAQDEIELVCDVHRVAFDRREEEPRLVQLLHAAGKTPISLAAHFEGTL
jgi:hypothetical protein